MEGNWYIQEEAKSGIQHYTERERDSPIFAESFLIILLILSASYLKIFPKVQWTLLNK